MEKSQWIFCPVCHNKTRIKIRENTMIRYLPLYCPKCKQESLINIEKFNMSIIKEPDAKKQSR
ncbi:cysteine-rich KTR domain-containing protein [Bacillus cytotoxicus]|uniref:cysteine-rich KTR domain-containing protein n=1 Tax=Bacillus cytotoxicus TaxID=580165 RepID=UPI000B351FE7|nr:cysteine-rich KTR domain-containing protein [Bacillus cytotoxicus]AWC27410.1 conjugal transfer protein [Bacillus cytotoxicus]AWC41215.1 conjugal transfer protein [Bacillus cytotoxicus]AWC49146.1 conjugal transfer protein [Bacillus cytotoxicus]AWC51476.1 conjugal transfer protein [Bacillus cytotoxicus]AWC55605.1 conjugal transfer protein [Bacillus cytotoxicus]